MDPLLGGAMVQGGTSLLNNLFNLGQAKKQREHQKQLAEYSYTKDLEMWNKANEYNKPEAQMSRLKEAGLNPNLAFGNGSVTGNTSTETPKYQAYNPEYGQLNMEMPNILGMLSQYQDIENKKAQYDVTQETLKRMQTENSYLGKMLGIKWTSELGDLGHKQVLLGTKPGDYNFDKNSVKLQDEYPLKKMWQEDFSQKVYDNESKKENLKYLYEGIQPSDNILLRMAVKNGLWDMAQTWIKKMISK